MHIVTVADAKEGGKKAFELLRDSMKKGSRTLGLATGSTPLTFYQEIVKSDLDFSQMISLNLDEYVGLSASHPQSYAYFMEEHLFKAKPFKAHYLPNGLAEDLSAEAKRYDELLATHPIDFQILGIGRNGHIGFNEPGTPFDETTHVVDLTESTIEANSRFFDNEEVPKQAISMGIASIIAAKQIVLMAYGKDKAEAIRGLVEGKQTLELPASSLKGHPHLYLVLDKEAASLLKS
ncbi:glucosamine-6-phosphate deaminase [Streptococcus sciuri]|uniref:Glucosamine-6-phosphate deaminase n=1 Tax=Streptococcus sciuri TaxID=2973939 RepID=A0ABT2F776_9STRE|nr:glucosamine-6-phosphate deaminase [Streptococcus sciuri]MCS4488284.1 glucosamine-6-phosphate deaminase [Streptococcus sciuri]